MWVGGVGGENLYKPILLKILQKMLWKILQKMEILGIWDVGGGCGRGCG